MGGNTADKFGMSRHHIIPRRNEELFHVSDPQNIARINDILHVNHHCLFDGLHPQEQLVQLFTFNQQTPSHQAKRKIMEVLNMEYTDFYLRKLIK